VTMTGEVVSEPMNQLQIEHVYVAPNEGGTAMPTPATKDWIAGVERELGYRMDEVSREQTKPRPGDGLQDQIDKMKRRWTAVPDAEFSVWADVVAEDNLAADEASAEVWPTD
jgi:hypothetical protein